MRPPAPSAASAIRPTTISTRLGGPLLALAARLRPARRGDGGGRFLLDRGLRICHEYDSEEKMKWVHRIIGQRSGEVKK
jgi:hypothetical protein